MMSMNGDQRIPAKTKTEITEALDHIERNIQLAEADLKEGDGYETREYLKNIRTWIRAARSELTLSSDRVAGLIEEVKAHQAEEDQQQQNDETLAISSEVMIASQIDEQSIRTALSECDPLQLRGQTCWKCPDPAEERVRELVLETDLVELKGLVRGNMVGVYTPNQTEGRSKNPVGGPFWYYRGVVQHHHRDDTLTVRIHDDGGRTLPQTLRFDTTFHAERSTPQWYDRYTLIPWTEAIERQIKIQKLSYLCWSIGSQWTYLSAQEFDKALTLANAAFSRYIDSDREPYREIVGKLGHVLSVHKRAVLSIGGWRYEVTITNTAEESGVLHIYSLLEVFPMRRPVGERLFSSLEECSRLLTEIGELLPPVLSDAMWSSTRY